MGQLGASSLLVAPQSSQSSSPLGVSGQSHEAPRLPKGFTLPQLAPGPSLIAQQFPACLGEDTFHRWQDSRDKCPQTGPLGMLLPVSTGAGT